MSMVKNLLADIDKKEIPWHWIVTTCISTLLLMVAGWGGWMMQRDTGFDDRMRNIGYRINHAEAELSAVKSNQDLILTQLNRIELRLDQVLSPETKRR